MANTKQLLLNFKQVCEALGVSERKGHQLRNEPWFPLGIVLGPQSRRWHYDEISEAARRLAPREHVHRQEPANFAQARERKVAT
jgi:predicted DNA-binding transcriptional regulator AlpA